MTQTLYHNPGQSVTVILETLSTIGARQDSASTPIVTRIILPSLNLAADYPQNMIRLDTGLYYYKFILPTGSTAIGTYIVDIYYIDPATTIAKNTAYQIIVTAASGNFGLASAV